MGAKKKIRVSYHLPESASKIINDLKAYYGHGSDTSVIMGALQNSHMSIPRHLIVNSIENGENRKKGGE